MSENTIIPDDMTSKEDGEMKNESKKENLSGKIIENTEKEINQIIKPAEENTQQPETSEISGAKKEEVINPPARNPRREISNYQISLLNQNLLKVNISTKLGVKINSSVRDRKALSETQSNEIYLYPKSDGSIQEIGVNITIDEDEVISGTANESQGSDLQNEEKHEIQTGNIPDENISNTKAGEIAKSNYQINLINENLLKVKIETGKGVRIDSVSRDKKSTAETQTNKIYLHPVSGDEIQIIDITIEIDTEKKEVILKDEEGNIKLIPNPEVFDLIQPPTYPVFENSDELFDPVTGYKNPFDKLRKLIQRNTAVGLTAAVIIHLIAAGIFFYGPGKSRDLEMVERSRLIVIQDLPDPKIKLADVDDPNKPKVEIPPPDLSKPDVTDPTREIKPRKTVRPPVITRPKRDDSNKDTIPDSDLTKELDSLRKLTGNTLKDTLKDSTSADTSKLAYEIPDSLRNNFNENDIGLAMYFPKNWKLTDQRDINKNEKDFKGVLLTDTLAEQPGTMTMFIYLDLENKDYNAEDFKTEFTMNDSALTAFLKEPKTLAGFTEYRFYIFNKTGTEKLSIRASVRKQFFDQYKNEIEAVVRSIRIKKKEDM
jgi:hypothetical protein